MELTDYTSQLIRGACQLIVSFLRDLTDSNNQHSNRADRLYTSQLIWDANRLLAF